VEKKRKTERERGGIKEKEIDGEKRERCSRR